MRVLGSQTVRSAAWVCAGIASLAFVHAPETAAAKAPWGGARILYFERFDTTIDPRPALANKRSGTRILKFDAYGQRYELALELNTLLQPAADSDAAVHLYRGQLTGVTGSWARVATRGSDVHGLIWDGAQLYAIEPTETVRDSLVPPLDARSAKTILFRLSDTIVEDGVAVCAASSAPALTGLDSYESMRRELAVLKGDPVSMQAATAAMRLQLSAIGDAAFRAQFSSDAAAIEQMLLRLNNVDGIFAAELGVQLQVPTALVYDAHSDPLPTTTAASDLLRQLATLRNKTPQLKSRGLTHLFTGRDLDGPTVGIGYIDTLCNAEFGVGLTEIRGRGAWLESLITAHELGHNFGAVHDGEEQCSAIAQNQFLMSPTVHAGHATFSSCSKNRMAERMRAASCIAPLPPADLSIPAELGTVHEGVGRLFDWELAVTNAGGRTSQQGRIEVLIPPSLRIEDAWIAGGSCTSGAGVIDCQLGDVAGGVTRALHLKLVSDTTGVHEISARVIAPTEAQTANNAGVGKIVIGRQLDLGITLQAPTTITAGETFSTAFSIANFASEAAQDVSVVFTMPDGVLISSSMIDDGSCDPSANTCTLASLSAGATVRGTLTLVAHSIGTHSLLARVSSASFDPNSPNDTASASIAVSSAAATSTGSESGSVAPTRGGGGALGLPVILAMLGFAWSRRLAR